MQWDVFKFRCNEKLKNIIIGVNNFEQFKNH